MVLVTLVLWCVVVTGVNLVICEKGRDQFREMMGVKMGSRYVELPRLVIDDVVVAMVVVGIVVVVGVIFIVVGLICVVCWLTGVGCGVVVGGGLFLVVTHFSVLSLY